MDILTREMLNDAPKIDRQGEIAMQWNNWRKEKKRREKKTGGKGGIPSTT